MKFPSVRHVAVCLRLYGRPLRDTFESMQLNPVETGALYSAYCNLE